MTVEQLGELGGLFGLGGLLCLGDPLGRRCCLLGLGGCGGPLLLSRLGLGCGLVDATLLGRCDRGSGFVLCLRKSVICHALSLITPATPRPTSAIPVVRGMVRDLSLPEDL